MQLDVDPDNFADSIAPRKNVTTDAARRSKGAASPQMQANMDELERAYEGIYYDAKGSRFFIPRKPGPGWVIVAKEDVKNHFQLHGVLKHDCPALIYRIQTEKAVDFAGAVAGYSCGHLRVSGKIVLVTAERKRIDPKKGEWPRIRKLITELLCPPAEIHGSTQANTLLGWVKAFIESLESGVWRHGQALALAGPTDCGKTFLLGLLTELFGGRTALPYAYMIGKSEFNSELFGAESLVIDDEVASTDIRSRRSLGQRIKSMIYSGTVRCHPKGRDAVDFRPFWRIMLAVNDETEALLILPPFDESLSDKLIVLKCHKATFPSAPSQAERQVVEAAFKAELPAFLHYILHEYKLPNHLVCQRNGVQTFRHPSIEKAVNELSPEEELLRILTQHFSETKETLTYTAQELERALISSSFGADAKRLLAHPNTCGTYLSRLSKRYPDFVTRGSMAHRNVVQWEIDMTAITEGTEGQVTDFNE